MDLKAVNKMLSVIAISLRSCPDKRDHISETIEYIIAPEKMDETSSLKMHSRLKISLVYN